MGVGPGFLSMRVAVLMRMGMAMVVIVRVAVVMIMRVVMIVFVRVRRRRGWGGVGVSFLLQMHVQLDAFDAVFLPAGGVQVVAGEVEFAQLPFEQFKLDAQIQERAQEHVAADAAEQVQIQRFHFNSPAVRALIWLAA